MGVRERRKNRKDGRLVGLVKLLLYIEFYSSCIAKILSRVYAVFLKTLGQSKKKGIPVQEKSDTLGMRLSCKARRDGQGKDIYWTDGDNHEHRMIVLVPYRRARSKNHQGMSKDWTSIYQDEDSSYIFEGLEMNDRELNLWLEGWNVDIREQLEKGGGHSPA